ncbi:MAG: adenosine kinase [Rhodobacteraceae bacterium]|nr:adenosine kinase [Paracoccaceae bacterium]
MIGKKYDVVSVGNAIVDVLGHVDESFLTVHGVTKGVMQLVDITRARKLYNLMSGAVERSGGSAANTAAGLALLGSRTAYIGKVKDDFLGRIFTGDLHGLGVDFTTTKLVGSAAEETGRSMILITPDGERSMNTYLGASEFLSPEDIDEESVTATNWLFLEGYRFDGPDSQAAYRYASRVCRRAGGRVAISLSDPFCIERHREAFQDLIRNNADMVIGNQEEFMALYEVTSLPAVVSRAVCEAILIVCTCSGDGVLVIENNASIKVDAIPTDIVDATGAGDQFAAGFLHGHCAGLGHADSAQIGCRMAAATISHIGPRPYREDVLTISVK